MFCVDYLCEVFGNVYKVRLMSFLCTSYLGSVQIFFLVQNALVNFEIFLIKYNS